MILFKPKGKEVFYLYPFAQDLQDKTTVYPFNADTIKLIVPKSVTCGNYRIGRLFDSDKFAPFYIGRVTDEPLSDRLIDHISEYGTKAVCFDFASAISALDAYKQECHDYHSFIGDGYLQNDIHPAKPKGVNTMCPVCGQ